MKGRKVVCVETWKSKLHPDVDFGVEGTEYTITYVLPRYGLVALDELGEAGEVNHFVNARRFALV
ncbi:hypothetical protein DSS3P8_148 [Roseobacter phage DSS3P8]|nr:hypothetical protein DSS3P8_148 [Roseobacter phage DSS3P8]